MSGSRTTVGGASSDTGCAVADITLYTVTDALAVAGDVGLPIACAGKIAADSRINSVNVGVGYTLSKKPTATGTGLTFVIGTAETFDPASAQEEDTSVQHGGKLTLSTAGAYSGTVEYDPGDVVSYTSELFVSLKRQNGVTPADGADWSLLVGNGSQGIQGIQGVAGPATISPTHATIGRPAAGAAGAIYYDTTLHVLGISDGAVWRDALGTAI
jgi:hypothetical protein